jgi:hypothetical protein
MFTRRSGVAWETAQLMVCAGSPAWIGFTVRLPSDRQKLSSALAPNGPGLESTCSAPLTTTSCGEAPRPAMAV